MIAVSSPAGQGLGWWAALIPVALELIKNQQSGTAPAPPPPPPPTGWAAWSTTTKVAVVGGGAAALGLVAYLVLRR